MNRLHYTTSLFKTAKIHSESPHNDGSHDIGFCSGSGIALGIPEIPIQLSTSEVSLLKACLCINVHLYKPF